MPGPGVGITGALLPWTAPAALTSTLIVCVGGGAVVAVTFTSPAPGIVGWIWTGDAYPWRLASPTTGAFPPVVGWPTPGTILLNLLPMGLQMFSIIPSISVGVSYTRIS